MRRVKPTLQRTRLHQEPETLFTANSFDDLANVRDNRLFVNHSDFEIRLELNAPVAHAFDAFGVESLFSPFMPPGTQLRDVSGEGDFTVLVRGEIVDFSEFSAGAAQMGIAPAVAAVAAFLVSWKGIILVSIGLVTLELVVKKITGTGIVERATGIDLWSAKTWAVIAIVGGVVVIGSNTLRR